MTEFPALFLDESIALSGGRGSSAIFLSIFGKYPAWTDFVTEFCPSHSLAAAEQIIREGLSASGSLPIDHFFLWTRGTQSLVGSMWESQDQTGRRFPAVVCAHNVNLGLEVVLKSVFDHLVEFRGICTSLVPELGLKTHNASSLLQKAVRSEYLAMQKRLAEMLSSKGQSSEISCVARDVTDAFVDSHEVRIEAGGFDSLIRFLLDRFSAFSPSRYRSDKTTNRAVCVRLPSGGLETREALFLWCRILQHLVHPTVPVLIVVPSSCGWVDVIVGEPKPHDLGCIRKSKQDLGVQRGTVIGNGEKNSAFDEELHQLLSMLHLDRPTHVRISGRYDRGGARMLADETYDKRQRNRFWSASGVRLLVGFLLIAVSSLACILWVNSRRNKTGSLTADARNGSELLLRQPEDKEVIAGRQVVFLAETPNRNGILYSWIERSSGRVVSTNNTLSLMTGPDQIGGRFEYRVVVRDSYIAVTSRWARLVVNAPPTNPGNKKPSHKNSTVSALPFPDVPRITKFLPSVVEIGEGKDLNLDAELSPPNLTVSWFFGGEKIEGSTSSELTIRGVSIQNSGAYTFVASNGSGSVTSNPARVVVLRRTPQISPDSTERIAKVGQPVKLSVVAQYADSIEWRFNGKPIGIGAVISIIPSSEADAGLYMAIARNESFWATSSIKLTIVNDPNPTTSSVNPTGLDRVYCRLGAPLDLRIDGVAATDGWRWSKDGVVIEKESKNYYGISRSDLDSSGLYKAERIGASESFRKFRVWIEMTNSIGMQFVWVPSLPRTKKGGWVGKFEVTQEEYEKVMHQNPTKHQTSPKQPVDSVSLAEAMLFCRELGNRTQTFQGIDSGISRYSLLTESQWEYAVRDTELSDSVTSFGRTRMRTSPEAVGSRSQNPQGLFDMRGNLWEWCLENTGEGAVCRGGSYGDSSERLGTSEGEGALAVGKKYPVKPDAKLKMVGFRCVFLTE